MRVPSLILAPVVLVLHGAAARAEDIPLQELIRLGNDAVRQGQNQGAIHLLRSVMEDTAFEGLSNADRDGVLTSLGQLLVNMDRHDEAEKVLDRVLEIQRPNPGSVSGNLPVILNNLGMVYLATGRYGLSERVLEEARRVIQERPDDFVGVHTQVLNNLGSLYLDTGRAKEGERWLNEALSVGETKLGENDIGLIPILNNLARAALQRKKWDRAETYLRRAIQLAEPFELDDHPWIGLIWNNLGYVYRGRRDFTSAATAFRQALENWSSVFGPQSVRVAVVSGNLAESLIQLGKYDEAEPLLLHAMEVLEGGARQSAATFARTLELYARLLRLESDHRALALEDRAREIRSDLHATVPVQALLPSR